MVTTSKVIAVTGASRGIGAAIALELARRGFTVGCLTRKGQGPAAPEAAEFASRWRCYWLQASSRWRGGIRARLISTRRWLSGPASFGADAFGKR